MTRRIDEAFGPYKDLREAEWKAREQAAFGPDHVIYYLLGRAGLYVAPSSAPRPSSAVVTKLFEGKERP